MPTWPDRQTLGLCLALLVVVFAAYSPVTHNSFTAYDDTGYITENSHVKAGLSWSTVEWAFTTFAEANWHPLTWLSHALDSQLFGLNPAGHHWVNVVTHGVNAVLLFLLLQYATGFRWRSLMVAALFALHPVNVESVAWAAERKNVLSTLFFLLAMLAYVWYTRRPSLGRYAAVAGLFALALLAKPQVITLPFLLLLWDYWPLGRGAVPSSWFSTPSPPAQSQRSFYFLLLEKIPLLLLSAASGVVTMAAQRAGLAVKPFSQYGLMSRVETATISYARYLGMAAWPSKLVAMYPHPTKPYPAWQVCGAALLLLAITALVVRARERRYLAVGWFWYLGSLVPMIGLVQAGDQALADRYAYISFIGLFVMVVWLVADWANGEMWAARRIPPRWLAVPAGCILLALGILTYRQVGYWHDPETFWRRTLALTEDNFVAEGGLGAYLRSHGRVEEAVVHFRAALALRPDDMPVMLNLGAYDHSHGNLEAAIEKYQFVAQHSANAGLRAKASANMGSAYHQLGQQAKAIESFEASLQAEPGQPSVMVALGAIEQTSGDLPGAIHQYTQAMRLQPTDVGFILLGNALLEEGGHEREGNAMLERANRISKNIDEAEKQANALLGRK